MRPAGSPLPFAASDRTSMRISRLEPTSTPTVGSSRSSTDGSTERFLATTTFCWLPPERPLTSWSRPVAWMLSCSTNPSADRRAAPSSTKPARANRRQAAIRMLWPTECSRTRPALPAILGHERDARRRAHRPAGGCPPAPVDLDRPAVEAIDPEDGPQQLAPAAARGARQSRRSRPGRDRTRRRSAVGCADPLTRRSGCPVRSTSWSWYVRALSSDLPSMLSMMTDRDRPAVGAESVTWPSRSTVTRSQMATTSSRWCEM